MQKENKNRIYKIYSLIMYIQIIFLIIDVYLPYKLNIARLSVVPVVNIAFDWMAMLMTIVMLNSCILGHKTKSSNSFMRLIVLIFFILYFEVGSWTVDGIEGLRPINYLANIGCNCLILISAAFYLDFVCDSLDIDVKEVSKLSRSVKLASIIGMAAEILNIWFGYFYKIDTRNIYVGNSIGKIIGFIPFVYIFVCSIVLVIRQELSFGKKLNYLIYAVVPLTISVWYSVTGLPPTLYMSAFISLVIIYGNIYIRQGQEYDISILENAKKDSELAWQRNQLTRSQIKPHFIFNCLGSIEQLCRIDADEARDAIHRFAKYLRVNMDAMSEQSLMPFSAELEHIRNYIWLEKMRFDDDLEYEEEIETNKFYLPPLSIQPIVENAVKHGMMGKEDGVLKVLLRVLEREDYFQIEIHDNGNGFDESIKIDDGRSHIGIQNVRESLKNMVDGDMTIMSRIGEGTVVIIKIPK